MAGRMGIFGVTQNAAGLMAAALLAGVVSFTGCGGKTRGEGGAAPGGMAGMERKDTASQGGWTRTDDKIRIRLHNLDTLALENVFVQWPVDSARFPLLPARGYTEYVALEKAYRYAFIKAQAGAQTWICQPVDFVGENLLGPGRYTYEISRAGVMEENAMGFLRLEMREDKEQP